MANIGDPFWGIRGMFSGGGGRGAVKIPHKTVVPSYPQVNTPQMLQGAINTRLPIQTSSPNPLKFETKNNKVFARNPLTWKMEEFTKMKPEVKGLIKYLMNRGLFLE